MLLRTLIALFFIVVMNLPAQSKTWVDSLDLYARQEYMPPKKFRWTWQRASLLFVMTKQYELASRDQKDIYLNYIQESIDKRLNRANGHSPNAVASALGTSFLAMQQKGEKYEKASLKVFEDYMEIPRTENAGVTHKKKFKELWDDTIFMIGIYLMNMYQWTGEEKYIEELFTQIQAHRDKLRDVETGLWVHGWDDDDKKRCNFCGQSGWSDNPQKRSQELWGRGNGWVIVTLAELTQRLPEGHPKKELARSYLKEMVINLPKVQDSTTGHWLQLPMRPEQSGNFIESSATAMFAYGILVALQENIVYGNEYYKAIFRAYDGLRRYSILPKGENYLTVTNICKGTCIGDMEYYLHRKAVAEKPSGIGMVLLFGRAYENFALPVMDGRK